MASYKKRGYKPKTKKEKEEQVEMESTTAEVFETLDQGASRTEAWISKNQTYVIGAVAAIAFGVLAYLGYQQFILEPKENEAASEIYQAQVFFDDAIESSGKVRDSLFNLALDGGRGKLGMLDVASNYSGTKTASLAHYYAGISYLNLGNYEQAIKHLDKFNGKDQVLAPLAQGAIGDAFLQLEQNKEALGHFETAAQMSKNSFTTPKFLLKAAITAIDLGESAKAEKHLKRIKAEFPNSDEYKLVEAYLGTAQAMK